MKSLLTIPMAVGIALGASLALGAGTEVTEFTSPALPLVNLGDKSRPCTMSGETATGREWGRLIVTGLRLVAGQLDVECSRFRTGGEAPPGAPHCKSRQFYESFGCSHVEDIVGE